MSYFKMMVEKDIQEVFLNIDFFGEIHNVEGNDISIILDDEQLKEKQGGQDMAIAASSVLMYAYVSDLPGRLPAGELLNIDGREFVIDDWSEDMGIAIIALSANIPA